MLSLFYSFIERKSNNSTKDVQNKGNDNFEFRSGRAPSFGREHEQDDKATFSLDTQLGQQSFLNLSGGESSISSAGVTGIVMGIFLIMIIGAGKLKVN